MDVPKHNTESCVKRLRERFGDKFDYSKVQYISAKTPITLICKEHGEFTSTPDALTAMKYGCSKCATYHNSTAKKKDTEYFIQRSTAVHGDRYRYDKSIYKTFNDELIITCTIHGDFKQRPGVHLRGAGCQKCGKIVNCDNNTKNTLGKRTDNFIQKSTKIHNGKYRYDKVEYVHQHSPVLILCPDCNQYFSQKPSLHICGKGCNICHSNGYNSHSPGNFYIQELKDSTGKISAYKFGITNKNPEARMKQTTFRSSFTHSLIFYISDDNGRNIRDLECHVIAQIPHMHLTKSQLRDGYTETISPAYISVLEDIIIEYASTGNFLDVKERCNQIKP